jgi:hypothetical protein
MKAGMIIQMQKNCTLRQTEAAVTEVKTICGKANFNG